MKLLSIIVPCYNEEKIIEKSAQVILDTVSKIQDYEVEIIFVNDGSKDKTLEKLCQISKLDHRYKYISFSRNFGKESAMLAGLEYCSGECVVIMDADLQHPPELIEKMITLYEQGYDQVIAQRNRKGDNKVNTFFARLYYKLVDGMVDVKMVDGAGDFRLLSRRAVKALLSLKENNRFSKGLFSWIGFDQIYIHYDNRERIGGETKWSFKKLLSYALDGILSFNNKPLRICIYFGFTLVGISILYLLYLLVNILRNGIDVPGYFTTIFLITCLGGIQLLSIGVIGEYIGRIYYEVKGRPNYLVQESNISRKEKDEDEKADRYDNN